MELQLLNWSDSYKFYVIFHYSDTTLLYIPLNTQCIMCSVSSCYIVLCHCAVWIHRVILCSIQLFNDSAVCYNTRSSIWSQLILVHSAVCASLLYTNCQSFTCRRGGGVNMIPSTVSPF